MTSLVTWAHRHTDTYSLTHSHYKIICLHTHTHTHTHTHGHTNTDTHTHTHARTRTHTHPYTHPHTKKETTTLFVLTMIVMSTTQMQKSLWQQRDLCQKWEVGQRPCGRLSGRPIVAGTDELNSLIFIKSKIPLYLVMTDQSASSTASMPTLPSSLLSRFWREQH